MDFPFYYRISKPFPEKSRKWASTLWKFRLSLAIPVDPYKRGDDRHELKTTTCAAFGHRRDLFPSEKSYQFGKIA
ncbi:MAG: hypothetical protein R3B93_09930 [Bacteroidia bacterium]